ncbi:alpha-E domain-containing protein [Akkermansiaceae bacterium]|nr:alpha-E domain-containing protein [Akkermansiaceae bacterium]
MLSRVANTLYWMMRYVERADNLARLIDVNEQLLLDFESLDSERLSGFWQPIILSTGDESAFSELYDEASSDNVISFLTEDTRNPNSIFSCIGFARENARTIRDQISDELWEELNAIYLFTRSDEALQLLRENPPRFYEEVRRSSMTVLGISVSTTARDAVWDFMTLGRYLERADKTTRFLDISTYFPKGAEGMDQSGVGVLHWSAILSSCGAMGAFRATGLEINGRTVMEYLLYSPDFPRSLRYCINKINATLHRISGASHGSFSTEAERETGKMLAGLSFGDPADVLEMGLHQYLDGVQSTLNKIAEEVFKTYVLVPEELPVPEAWEETTGAKETKQPLQQQQRP